MDNWNDKVKRILKSELIKRGVSNANLVFLLKEIEVHETKASIDSKISRGTFSACFFFQYSKFPPKLKKSPKLL